MTSSADSGPAQGTPSASRPRISTVFLLASIAATYLPSLHAGVVSDEWFLHSLGRWFQEDRSRFLTVFWESWGGRVLFYRPASLALYAALTAVSGDHRWILHALCLVLHLANTLLVGVLARRLRLPGGAAWLAMAFFGLHPRTAQTVAWCAILADLLCLVGLLTSVLSYARSRESGGSGIRPGAVLGFLLALTSKETGVILPALLAAWEVVVIPRQGPLRRCVGAFRQTIPWWIAVVVFGLLRSRYVTTGLGLYHESMPMFNPLGMLARIAKAVLAFFVPGEFEVGAWLKVLAVHPTVLLAVGAGALLLVYTLRRSLRSVTTMFCLLGFAIGQAPTVLLALSIRDSEMDRFLYASLPFACIGLASLVPPCFLVGLVGRGLLAIVLGCMALVTARTAALWTEAGTLANDSLERLGELIEEQKGFSRLRVVCMVDSYRGVPVLRGSLLPWLQAHGRPAEDVPTDFAMAWTYLIRRDTAGVRWTWASPTVLRGEALDERVVFVIPQNPRRRQDARVTPLDPYRPGDTWGFRTIQIEWERPLEDSIRIVAGEAGSVREIPR